MRQNLRCRRLRTVVGGLFVVLAGCHLAAAQEIIPDPALSQARSASLANGGIESEWEYHRRANLPSFRPRITPISKFAGGPGYCTPSITAPYYGCDRSGRACGCR